MRHIGSCIRKRKETAMILLRPGIRFVQPPCMKSGVPLIKQKSSQPVALIPLSTPTVSSPVVQGSLPVGWNNGSFHVGYPMLPSGGPCSASSVVAHNNVDDKSQLGAQLEWFEVNPIDVASAPISMN